MTRRYWNINLEEMLEVGVHFGHGTRKWNPRMAPFISAKRKGIHITNLTKTARFLSEANVMLLGQMTKILANTTYDQEKSTYNYMKTMKACC